MRRLNSKFTTKYISEAGDRPQNKDYFGFVELDGFACWAIAESHDNANDMVSAQLAVDTVLSLFTKKPTLSKRRLKAYIREAHRQLREQSDRFRLEASILIVASDYKRIRYALCGNCRMYLFRGMGIHLKSQDQSHYQELIKEGKAAEDGEKGMEESRNLFSYLGMDSRPKIFASKKIELLYEDVIFLSTWGLWEKINNVELLDALEEAKGPLAYLDEIQDLYLSKQDGRLNNFTMAAIFAEKTFQEGNRKRKIIIITIIVILILIILCLILFFYLRHREQTRAELVSAVIKHEDQGDTYLEEENFERALGEYESGKTKSEELKETKGEKGAENTEIKDDISRRHRVAQLIVDGDALFSEGSYEEAEVLYRSAIKELQADTALSELLSISELENKISLSDEYLYIEELTAVGDSQAGLEQYNEALASYREAQKLAAAYKNKEAEKDLKLKIDEAVSLQKAIQDEAAAEEKAAAEQALAERTTAVEVLELSGDQALTEENYLLAMEYYQEASRSYVKISALDKAAAVEAKIIETNEKIRQQEDDVQISIADGYIQMAEIELLENKFQEALDYYRLAREIFVAVKSAEDVLTVDEKISDTKAKAKEFEVLEKVMEIEDIEAEGDVLLTAGNYGGAKEKYLQAQLMYKDLNQTDLVAGIEEKIDGVETLENAEQAEQDAEQKEEEEKANEQLVYDAQLLEYQAETAMGLSDYKQAYEYYTQALEKYKQAGALDAALPVEKKLVELEEKLN